MKKKAKKVKLVEATKSRVDTEFIRKSSLPREKAIHVAARLAGVSDRAARRQWRRANEDS